MEKLRPRRNPEAAAPVTLCGWWILIAAWSIARLRAT
jgi:hypothetical protein